jgi:hypothetical protein
MPSTTALSSGGVPQKEETVAHLFLYSYEMNKLANYPKQTMAMLIKQRI